MQVSLLCRPLGLRRGESYAILIKGLFHAAASTSANARPTSSQTTAWLMEIDQSGSPGLACETAEWVGHQLETVTHRHQALDGALLLARKWAAAAKACPTQAARANGEAEAEATANADPAAAEGDLEMATNAVERLRATVAKLENQTALQTIQLPGLLDELEGYARAQKEGEASLVDPAVLVPALLRTASSIAVKRAQTRPDCAGATASAADSAGRDLDSNAMATFHETALRVHEAARDIAKRNPELFGGQWLKSVAFGVVRAWLDRPAQNGTDAGGGGEGRAASGVGMASPTAHSTHTSSRGGHSTAIDDSDSVFHRTRREETDDYDTELGLRIAFVVAPFAVASTGASKPDAATASSASSSTAETSVASTAPSVPSEAVVYLLKQALVGKETKQATRTQLRALRSLAVVAPPAMIQTALDALNKAKGDAPSGKASANSSGDLSCSSLPELALHEVQLSQQAALEDLRLPTTGLRDARLAEPLIRALWRDHRREAEHVALVAELMLQVR